MSRRGRLDLGLTDQERDQRDELRRTRNCLWLLAAIFFIIGIIELPR